eukprot:CAMPEP_0176264928 /NCGR_PEP_ID=MMETSP0121_2-20121125/41879_1 /TAXON_ID=160619 /ORGANISM="Kryptoperidinium foliaceum, Strain CCMP 1326" /LENGTH=32 /DNA_ID= /DNA_START= /DNA_END= /DNA_ORIENTATION=
MAAPPEGMDKSTEAAWANANDAGNTHTLRVVP